MVSVGAEDHRFAPLHHPVDLSIPRERLPDRKESNAKSEPSQHPAETSQVAITLQRLQHQKRECGVSQTELQLHHPVVGISRAPQQKLHHSDREVQQHRCYQRTQADSESERRKGGGNGPEKKKQRGCRFENEDRPRVYGSEGEWAEHEYCNGPGK